MSVVRLQNVTVRFDQRLVLREVFLKIRRGDRLGLIGKNGSGKTTLLHLVLGRSEPTEGVVDLDPGLRIGYFSQFSELEGSQTVLDVLEAVFADVRDCTRELEAIEEALHAAGLGSAETDRLLARQADLLQVMADRDGWMVPVRIDTVLNKLGFNEERRRLPIDQLSGGWRNRACLAKILLEEPDILLLDEPTNYLDVDGVAWLEEWLAKLRGALVVVSHDRQFLDRVVTRIVEIENYRLQEYEGGYSSYVREKPLRMKTLERQFEHEEELLILEAEALKDRSEAMRQPGGRVARRIADIKKATTPRPVQAVVTSIYERLTVRDQLLRVEGLAKAYGGEPLFRNLDIEIGRGEKVAIVGPNGCGKSTLLRVLTGAEGADAGKVAWLSDTQFADYNAILQALDPKDSVSHAANVFGLGYLAPRRQVHRFLGMLRFSEMDLNQRIGTLSGGQKARLALAQCLLSGASVLVMDEPTNHLDVSSIQVMEQALIYFPGAALVVSHDRFFIDKVANRLLVFDTGGVREVTGNWSQWSTPSPGP